MNEIPLVPSITVDTIRLLVIPMFVYASYLDYKSRRIYNELWVPVIGIALVVLFWDIGVFVSSHGESNYLFELSKNVIIVPSIAFFLWENDIIGGADLKAIALLSVIFPQQPYLFSELFPVFESMMPAFGIVIIMNSLIISMLYRGYLISENIYNMNLNTVISKTRTVKTTNVLNMHGDILLRNTDEQVDIDVLKSYFNWRGIRIDDFLNTQKSLDKKVVSDKNPYELITAENIPYNKSNANKPLFIRSNNNKTQSRKDTENNMYTKEFTELLNEEHELPNKLTPETINKALLELKQYDETIITPSIPFLIPLTLGLLASLTIGSIYSGVIEILTVFFKILIL